MHQLLGDHCIFSVVVQKRKKCRVSQINCEINLLWERFSFPKLSAKRISDKIGYVLNKYEIFRKNSMMGSEKFLKHIFDVTNGQGTWLTQEDKNFYQSELSG